MSDTLSPQSLLEQMIHSMISGLWYIAKHIFTLYWPYIIGFFVIVVAGIILQIIMLKSGSRSKLSSGFNSMVGSFIYSIFFLIYFLISYWIFGTQVVDEIWFTVFGSLSFPSTWYFLRGIGFWYY
jgi:hypothetical protein